MSSAATIQQKFSTAMLAKLAELKGGQLKKLAEIGDAKGGESFTFYRMDESTAKAGIPTMFGEAYGDNGGDMVAYKATIGEISVQQKVKESDMKKTQLDIKSAYVKSMANALATKEDEEIITAVMAEAGLRAAGDNTKAISDMTNVKRLIAEVRNAHVGAGMTPDGVKGVAIVMNRADYTELSTSDAFINGDYADAFRGGNGDLPLSFYGAEVIVTNKVAAGTSLVIPSNTFGFAEWEGSANADAAFFPTDGRRWHLQTDKSVGVVVIEPAHITKFSSLVGA